LSTDEEIIRKSISEANIAVGIIRTGRLDAGAHFWRALEYLDNIKDLPTRRKQLIHISTELFNGFMFYDLSLFAVQSAIEIDKILQDQRTLVADIIAYGNINMNMGNNDLAADNYRKAIDICLKNKDYADAASASTNLAGILASNGKMLEAIPLLYQSIEFLRKDPFPETEINTRLLLINVLYLQKTEPTKIIENAEALYKLYPDRIPKDPKKMVAGALESAIERYLLEHPELEIQSWKKQKLPLLSYWKSGE
jgi:tetratricopeptide (TPR) repeat protein